MVPEQVMLRRLATPLDSPARARDMSLSGAALFAAGGVAVLASLLADAGREVPRERIAVVVASAFTASAVLFVVGRRLPEGAYHGLVVVGVAMVTVVVHQAGGGLASAGYSSLYVITALYSFFFFRRGLALAHLIVVAAASFLAFQAVGQPGWWALWVMLMATTAMAGVLVNVLVEQVRVMARADMLTGLANRRAWEESLPREVARAARAARPLSVAVIDLDYFKEVNDAGGHQAGDQALRSVAAAWASQIRDVDLLARYGGDEFALVMPDCDSEQGAAIVDRLREMTPPELSFSAGIATWDGDESITDLVRRADEALYSAKKAGRSRTVISV